MDNDYIPLSFERGIKCERCKKIFHTLRPSEWAYKKRLSLMKRSPGDSKKLAHYTETKFFCSWGCMRAWENENQPEIRKDDTYNKRFDY